jgi:4-hydroxy-tetrahydrodipicolinate synthase
MSRRHQSPRFGAVVTAMVTPFDADGAVDLDAAAGLARWLVDHGSDGLVVTGTTGEGPTLDDDEKRSMWRAVAEAVTVPVVAGAGTNDTAHSVAAARDAAAAGVDAVLAVTPYYNRPSQAGIEAHFRAVAGASDLPVLIYDIPVRAGRKVASATLATLAHEVPTIVAVKDASGDPAGSAALIASTPDDFEVYSGDDALTLPLLAVGAVGVISVASHWAGRELAELVAAFSKGDHDGARAVNARLLESYTFESTDEFPNPLPAKAACRVLGLPVGQCRLPMGAAPASLDERARTVLAGLGSGSGSAGSGGRAGAGTSVA